jgi:hypothetical protein
LDIKSCSSKIGNSALTMSKGRFIWSETGFNRESGREGFTRVRSGIAGKADWLPGSVDRR